MEPLRDRMPPLARETMDELQRAAADELIAGPRKGVKGPFIPLMRSPRLLAPLQKAGEYLRFDSALSRRVSEFATLVVSRQWTQQFEWLRPRAAGAAGRDERRDDRSTARSDAGRPTMSAEEAFVYDFVVELTTHRGVSDATYAQCIERFGERGVIDLVGLIGYFTMISMVLNVAHTPANEVPGVAAACVAP